MCLSEMDNLEALKEWWLASAELIKALPEEDKLLIIEIKDKLKVKYTSTEQTNPKESDKLFINLGEWKSKMGDKVFQKKIIEKFPDREYPKTFTVSDLRVALKLCAAWEKKRTPF